MHDGETKNYVLVTAAYNEEARSKKHTVVIAQTAIPLQWESSATFDRQQRRTCSVRGAPSVHQLVRVQKSTPRNFAAQVHASNFSWDCKSMQALNYNLSQSRFRLIRLGQAYYQQLMAKNSFGISLGLPGGL